jgi:hypothetical protein
MCALLMHRVKMRREDGSFGEALGMGMGVWRKWVKCSGLGWSLCA